MAQISGTRSKEEWICHVKIPLYLDASTTVKTVILPSKLKT